MLLVQQVAIANLIHQLLILIKLERSLQNKRVVFKDIIVRLVQLFRILSPALWEHMVHHLDLHLHLNVQRVLREVTVIELD